MKGKPIVFLELGYDESTEAAREPWKDGNRAEGAADVQALCLDRALAALEKETVVVGAFLWKWFPGEPRRGNFRMQKAELREVIAKRWLE